MQSRWMRLEGADGVNPRRAGPLLGEQRDEQEGRASAALKSRTYGGLGTTANAFKPIP